jgi:hypothetical protein
MTNSVRIYLNSYWSSQDMNHTHTIMSLLTKDLGVRSSGSYGRALRATLEQYCFDLRETESPVDFALRLQSSDIESRKTLEELLGWTGQETSLQLVALVALAPELEHAASRISRSRPSDDAMAEILAQATDALRWTHEFGEGERVAFVLSHALSRTRMEQRRLARHNVPAVAIPLDFDVAETEEPSNEIVNRLARAVDRQIITAGESQLIVDTRIGESSLQSLAAIAGDTYSTLRKRRARAESRLRHFYGVGWDFA